MTAQSLSEKVAFWELDHKNEGQPISIPSSVQPCICTSGTVDIGIFEEPEDIRIPVEKADVKPGGKYHSILKLFFRFGASQTWTTATGWLLDSDIVVTAAHCIYEDNQRATCAIACIGYDANPETTDISTGEQRLVSRVVMPFEWIASENEQHDMAFLQLNSPFENATPIARGTPEINTLQQITVIGYPTDLGTGEKIGDQMYKMQISRDINLKRTKRNMLVYQGDFKGGFSGAPVIRDSDFAAIGVHARGGSFNSAVVIDGPYGVRFQAYEEVLRMLDKGSTDSALEIETDINRNWLKYIHVLYESQF
ncbi:hypothetical protein TWF694_011604 [Orbilia ellipsospora]|uniref:Serine protease n=1 Tax=Orbilia ellipsospora TaxID=2528407 RepID=A0AAV9X6W6_9PEZI